jgi:hypothetical protein
MSELVLSNLTIQGRPLALFEESPTRLIFSDTSEDTQTGSITNTYNVSLGTYSYILFKITQKIDSASGACDMWIEFNGKTGTWPAHSADIWRFRSHNNWRNYQPIRCCRLYTNTDPVDWCDNLQSNVTRRSPQDGETCYYYNQSTPNSRTYAVHSLLINNNTGIAKHYIDGNYTCNGNLVTGGVFTAISKDRETGMNYFYKDIYIYGSESEADLLQYINNN